MLGFESQCCLDVTYSFAEDTSLHGTRALNQLMRCEKRARGVLKKSGAIPNPAGLLLNIDILHHVINEPKANDVLNETPKTILSLYM